MKLTCSDTTASGARRFASSGVRSRGTAADRSAPIPPSATIAGPLERRSRKRFAVCVAGTDVSFSVARHILPGSARPGLAPCFAEQVAEASQGRFPRPLSMRSGHARVRSTSLAKRDVKLRRAGADSHDRMRRYVPHFLVLAIALAAVGYGAGFAESRFGLSAAAVLSTFGAGVLLLEKRVRTRKARAGAWSTLVAGCFAIVVALVPGAQQLVYAAPVLAGAVFAVLSRPKRRPRKPHLGPPGGVNRLSQPSSGDG